MDHEKRERPSVENGGAGAAAGGRDSSVKERPGELECIEEETEFSMPGLRRVTPMTVALVVIFTLSTTGLLVVLNLRFVRDQFAGEGVFWVMRVGLLLMIATVLAVVIGREINNTRYVEHLLADVVDVNRRMRLLLDAGRGIGSTLEMDEILDGIIEYISLLTDADVCAVYLWDKQADALRFQVARGIEENNLMFKALPMNTGLMGEAAAKRRTVAVDDTSEIDERDNPFFGAAKPASLILVPLQARGKFLGMLAAACLRRHVYRAEEKVMLDGLGEIASLSITNAELYRIARKSLDALSKERGVTDSVLEEMVAGVITSDSRGRISVFNREAQRITGFTFAEKTQALLKPESSLDQNPLGPLERGMLDVLNDPRDVREGDAIIMKTDGALLPVSYRIYPLMSAKDVVGTACVFMESHADAAGGARARRGPVDYQLLLRSLGARIEHVYTHPLSRVIERMRGMTAGDWSSGREDILRTMEAGYSTLLGLLEDLEQYLNCTTTREWDTPGSYDIVELTGEVVRGLIASPEAEGAAVSVRLHGLPRVFGYERMIKTALEHVIENACIASSFGDGKVEVSGSERDGFVRVEVRDSGPGISEESGQFMFMPFFTSWEGRSGLGLSVVKRVMQRLGGATGAAGSPSGALFFLEFPTSASMQRPAGDDSMSPGEDPSHAAEVETTTEASA